MPQVMNQLDILVLPSRETTHWKELFGRVLIEAMASGVAVVASNSGGIPEVVGGAGVLFEPNSVADLREKLSDLVTDQLRRSLFGNRGRERALAFFDMPVVAGTLKKNLMSLVNSRWDSEHD
jgi:glycosyltransferase involved in cell wall biosynthesis